jgi:hypothetical protein
VVSNQVAGKGAVMEYLLEFLLGKAYRSVDSYSRLKALATTKDQQGSGLVPLDPLSNPLDVLLQFAFALAIVVFFSTLYLGYTDGMGATHAYFAIGSFFASAFFLWLLFHIDSRYYLDMKTRRVIYRFSFFVKISESVLASFSNIVSVELDAHEVGKTAAGSWNYHLVIVKKDLSRVPITRSGYSASGLPETGQLIANAIKCPYREGQRIEKMRIMGL